MSAVRKTKEQPARILVDRTDGQYYVSLVYADASVEDTTAFKERDTAEQHAATLAKRYGCEWETNY